MNISVIVATLWECDPHLLNDEEALAAICRQACTVGGFQLLNLYTHRFEPQGVTVVGALAESHITLHTWPEHGALWLDIGTCTGPVRTRQAFACVCERICHGRIEQREMVPATVGVPRAVVGGGN